MDPKVKAKYKARAKIIKAMSHPTRLFIVDKLSQGEQNVCDLTEMVGDDISTISRHLSVLKDAGIVTDERMGTRIFYFLRVPCVLDFFSCVESILKTNAEDQAMLVGR